MAKREILVVLIVFWFLLPSCKKNEALVPVVAPQIRKTFEPSNLRPIYACVSMPYLLEKKKPSAAAVGKIMDFWPNNLNGRTVFRIKFVNGGSDYVRAKIQLYAREWERHANVYFDFVADDQNAEIRISNTLGIGSWSYHGVQNLNIASSQATMNYGWFTDETPDSEFRRVVMHEFGHMLGLGHEHGNPLVSIQWNKPFVYFYYLRTNGWSTEVVDHNVFNVCNATHSMYSEYDPTSIMHYPIPKEFTVNGVSVDWNTELSDQDKNFIQKVYPFAVGTRKGADL